MESQSLAVIFLTDLFSSCSVQTPLGMDYKDCLVLKGTDFCLSGLQRHFCSLRELLGYYQHSGLLLAGFPTKLGPCCPPKPKGESLARHRHTDLLHWFCISSIAISSGTLLK